MVLGQPLLPGDVGRRGEEGADLGEEPRVALPADGGDVPLDVGDLAHPHEGRGDGGVGQGEIHGQVGEVHPPLSAEGGGPLGRLADAPGGRVPIGRAPGGEHPHVQGRGVDQADAALLGQGGQDAVERGVQQVVAAVGEDGVHLGLCGDVGEQVQGVRYLLERLREARRERRYDAVILDPPTFGRGQNNELYKIEKDLPETLHLCRGLLSDEPLFMLLSAHTPGYTPVVLGNVLGQAVSGLGGRTESGEMVLNGADAQVLPTPCGAYARWSRRA